MSNAPIKDCKCLPDNLGMHCLRCDECGRYGEYPVSSERLWYVMMNTPKEDLYGWPHDYVQEDTMETETGRGKGSPVIQQLTEPKREVNDKILQFDYAAVERRVAAEYGVVLEEHVNDG